MRYILFCLLACALAFAETQPAPQPTPTVQGEDAPTVGYGVLIPDDSRVRKRHALGRALKNVGDAKIKSPTP